MTNGKRVPCQCCGSLFEPFNYWQKFCSTYCKKKQWREDHPAPKKDRSSEDFAPSKEVILIGRNCEVCGVPLRGIKGDNRTWNKTSCSHACSQLKYLAKKAGSWAEVEIKGEQIIVTRPIIESEAQPVSVSPGGPAPMIIDVGFALHEGHIANAAILADMEMFTDLSWLAQ